MHILILDDSKSYGDLLASACKKLGHQSVVLQEPAEALAYLKEHEVEAFMVDLDMPKVKGTVFTTLVRQQGCTVPIAICTGSCVDEELTAKAMRMGEVLPKIWTHADLRGVLRALQLEGRAESVPPSLPPSELMVNLPAHDGAEEDTRNELGGPQAARKLAKGTGTTTKDSLDVGDSRKRSQTDRPRGRGSSVRRMRKGAPRVHVRCSAWEQIRKLCGDIMSGSTKITVRAQANLANDQRVVLALTLPDDMVVSLDAKITDTRTAGPDGKRPYQLDLVGFGGDEMAYLLERCDENESTAPDNTKPVTERPRPRVALAPSTPADTRPSIPESIDAVDIKNAPSYSPKISWD